MAVLDSFRSLLDRVRAGDADAAREIVTQYESVIRVSVRTRLSDPALRRQFDSMDVCQSVFASFFLRAAAGQFDLDDPSQLVALLTKMARNKLASQSRRALRQRRDVKRSTSLDAWSLNLPERRPGPSQSAVARDLLRRAFELMTPEVREIAALRRDGLEWSAIAAQLGGTAEARRKQFERALDRTAQLLSLES